MKNFCLRYDGDGTAFPSSILPVKAAILVHCQQPEVYGGRFTYGGSMNLPAFAPLIMPLPHISQSIKINYSIDNALAVTTSGSYLVIASLTGYPNTSGADLEFSVSVGGSTAGYLTLRTRAEEVLSFFFTDIVDLPANIPVWLELRSSTALTFALASGQSAKLIVSRLG